MPVSISDVLSYSGNFILNIFIIYKYHKHECKYVNSGMCWGDTEQCYFSIIYVSNKVQEAVLYRE